jgi:hypothetical protein
MLIKYALNNKKKKVVKNYSDLLDQAERAGSTHMFKLLDE